jgi:hypothetical protein
MKQLNLFAKSRQTRKPRHASDTSRSAAKAVASSALALRRRVFDFIESRGSLGATDHEIQTALAIAGDTERPRRDELQKAGLVRDSGQRRTAPSGRSVIVWVTTGKPFPQENSPTPFSQTEPDKKAL